MSQQEILHFVADLLPTWRKTRQRVLALGSHALLRRRCLTLCGIARGLERHTRVLHRVKRIWRVLSNRAVDPCSIAGVAAPGLCIAPHRQGTYHQSELAQLYGSTDGEYYRWCLEPHS